MLEETEMHIVTMLLQHVVICKISEFILHRAWLEIKKAFELALTAFVLWLISPILKEVERVFQGAATLLLLIAAGFLSNATFNLTTAPARQKA